MKTKAEVIESLRNTLAKVGIVPEKIMILGSWLHVDLECHVASAKLVGMLIQTGMYERVRSIESLENGKKQYRVGARVK